MLSGHLAPGVNVLHRHREIDIAYVFKICQSFLRKRMSKRGASLKAFGLWINETAPKKVAAMKMIRERTTVSSALPLIFLPGTVCDERIFEPVLQRVSHPGDIGFAPLNTGRSMREVAAAFLAEAPPRFLLVGFSLGGIASLEIAAQAPERVAGLCLIDTTPRPDPPENALVRRVACMKARNEGMAGYIADAWARLVASSNRDNAALRQTIIDMAVASGADLLDLQTDMAIHRVDSRPRLGAIPCPTLILAGVEEQVCPLEAHREIELGIAGSEFHLIAGAGHFSPLENPQAVASHIQDWLRVCGPQTSGTQSKGSENE